MRMVRKRHGEKGQMLLVVVFIATAIAGLAAISASRVVAETKHQQVMEEETRAFQGAYSQLHMALNIVNTSAYNDQNQNLQLRDAITGVNGGTVAGEIPETFIDKSGKVQRTIATKSGKLKEVDGPSGATAWLDHEEDPEYGFLVGTNVRVYRGREYIRRLQRLKGETLGNVDPTGDSDAYFVVEAAGRSGGTIRLVSALVRENEPFSSFVFFQNRATLGVSGAPRGLIHSNEKLDFYFPNGNYMDSVSAVDGFGFQAGATAANTSIRDGNPEATKIALEAADFDLLKTKSDLYVGEDGLDAEIRLQANGKVKVKPHTPPRYEKTVKTWTYQRYVGREQQTTTEIQPVKVGTREVPYEKNVKVGTREETYYVDEDVKVGTRTETYTVRKKFKIGTDSETRYRDVTVQTGTKEVEHSREDPVYEEQTVTRTRRVKVWQEYESGGAGGGTSVGGGAGGAAGEWVWVDEEYQTTEMVQVGTKTVTWTTTEPVYTTQKEPYTYTWNVYEWRDVEKSRTVDIIETRSVEKTRTVDIIERQTFYRTENVYEDQEVEVTRWVNLYEDVTIEYETWEYFAPTYMKTKTLNLGEGKSGTMFIDGRVTRLQGDLQGRLTIVGNEKVRVTGNLRYVDKKGETAMNNGDDYTQPYERNSDYVGKSVLGVIARGDIVMTSRMPKQAEINGTLMSVHGRVGIDGFWADEAGELVKDNGWASRVEHMTEEEYVKEYAYDNVSAYKTKTFKKDSLRRIGGIVSNNRVIETYITPDKNGYATVNAGFKRGNMRFDINLLFNPPPNFVEVPRPVVTAFVPIVLVRNND